MLRHFIGGWIARLGFSALSLVVWAGSTGCDAQNNPVLGILNGGQTVVAAAIDVPELGNEWISASQVVLPDSGGISISAKIDSGEDVDVFDLGAVSRGDRIVIETSQSSGLDAAAGLFDDRSMLLMVNDDRSYSLGMYDPYINHVIREDLTKCYVVVAASPYQPSTGSYTLTIRRTRNATVPAPQGQAVLLDFDGASGVQIGSRTPINVPAFNAANISSKYAGQTDEIIDRIEQMVYEDYEDYDIDIYSTANGDNPSGEVTRVFFGTYDADLLGLADTVDPYNTRPTEECIIFTDTFRLFMPLNPSAEQMAIALANVATHELGHLLGLNHTKDTTEIMDISASAQELLVDQTFHNAPLEDGIFPVGWQDPHMLLMQALGAR